MYICTTAYLVTDNEITKGGLGFKISMERVGRMLAAKKDSYKRVYNNNSTAFRYPKVPENLLRKKGDSYFQIIGDKCNQRRNSQQSEVFIAEVF